MMAAAERKGETTVEIEVKVIQSCNQWHRGKGHHGGCHGGALLGTGVWDFSCAMVACVGDRPLARQSAALCCLLCLKAAKEAELAQSVERTTLNRVVVGSIPTFGVVLLSLLFCDPFF